MSLEPPRPRDAVRGADLCEIHIARLEEGFSELVTWYRHLEASQTRRTRLNEATVTTSGHTDLGTLWNPAATSALAELNDWIAYLVRTVNRERPGGPHVAEAHPHLQLEILRRHHSRWLALYPTLGSAWLDDVYQLNRRVDEAMDQKPVRRILLTGRGCAHVDWHPDYGEYYCGGDLYGIVDTPEPMILCSTNPDHVITRDAWMDHA